MFGNKLGSDSNADFYWENGFIVFTEAFHLKRGYCCKNGCRHCPYQPKRKVDKQKITISWSGGKDSAFALYKILQCNVYDVVSLHTIINEQTRRVGMHGVREELIDQQAACIGIPLRKIYLESSESHAAYETLMRSFYKDCAVEGIYAVAFGDIFLEDLRRYREELLSESALLPIFPLWKIDSTILIHDFINAGFKTLICSANSKFFKRSDLGKTIDHVFVNNLPDGVDSCGENGEFHTLVYDGPIFKKPIALNMGEIVTKHYTNQQRNEDGSLSTFETNFLFQDLLS